MSEDNTGVTIGMLNAFGEGLVKIINEQVSQMIKQNNETILNTISQNNASQFDSINGRINEIINHLRGNAQPEQPQAAPQPELRSQVRMNEVPSLLRELIAAAKEVNLLPGDEPTDLQKWGMAAAEVAHREALLSLKGTVRQGLRKKIITAPEVQAITGDMIDAAIGAVKHTNEPL